MQSQFVIKIKLDTIDKVKSFVNDVQSISIPVTMESGIYKVDAKSIMGIFSLNLSDPVFLSAAMLDEEDKSEVEKLCDIVKPYECD